MWWRRWNLRNACSSVVIDEIVTDHLSHHVSEEKEKTVHFLRMISVCKGPSLVPSFLASRKPHSSGKTSRPCLQNWKPFHLTFSEEIASWFLNQLPDPMSSCLMWIPSQFSQWWSKLSDQRRARSFREFRNNSVVEHNRALANRDLTSKNMTFQCRLDSSIFRESVTDRMTYWADAISWILCFPWNFACPSAPTISEGNVWVLWPKIRKCVTSSVIWLRSPECPVYEVLGSSSSWYFMERNPNSSCILLDFSQTLQGLEWIHWNSLLEIGTQASIYNRSIPSCHFRFEALVHVVSIFHGWRCKGRCIFLSHKMTVIEQMKFCRFDWIAWRIQNVHSSRLRAMSNWMRESKAGESNTRERY
jgi:hypothetical protein